MTSRDPFGRYLCYPWATAMYFARARANIFQARYYVWGERDPWSGNWHYCYAPASYRDTVRS